MPTAAANLITRLRGNPSNFGSSSAAKYLAHTVRTEVEAQNAVTILHSFVVTDHRRQDEFVGDVVSIGILHRFDRIVVMGAFAFGQCGIRLGDAIPALVAIHRIIAADHRADRHLRRQRLT